MLLVFFQYVLRCFQYALSCAYYVISIYSQCSLSKLLLCSYCLLMHMFQYDLSTYVLSFQMFFYRLLVCSQMLKLVCFQLYLLCSQYIFSMFLVCFYYVLSAFWMFIVCSYYFSWYVHSLLSQMFFCMLLVVLSMLLDVIIIL